MKQRLATPLVLLLTLGLGVAGCSAGGTDASANNGASNTTAATSGSIKATGTPIKVGIVTFTTGPAAEPFGVPARNGAQLLIDALNRGELPAPYDQPGIAGHPIEPVFVDENGGATTAVTNYRRLVQDDKVDVVVGYISSGDCLAVAPVAEELKKFTLFFDCGTSTLFDKPLQYVYRTTSSQVTDSVGAAQYIHDTMSDVSSIAGINQNYAWGTDSWDTFEARMKSLVPSVQVKDSLLPKIYTGDYSTEISKLLADKADVVHSSFWGGDLDGLVTQGIPRGLNKTSHLVLAAGDTALPRLGAGIPAGVIIGARGPGGALAPEGPLNDWLGKAYEARYNDPPTYPVYHMAQAIFGLKAAWEKAGATATPDDVMKALTNLTFDTPSGPVAMTLQDGHQALQGTAYGTTGEFDPSTGEVKLVNIKRYAP